MASSDDLDRAYIRMAQIWSSLSKARRKKVGCLIVKNGSIISDGYNGTPKSFDNQCEDIDFFGQLVTRKEVLHAESNAITKLSKSTQSSKDSTMYITVSPCVDCAKLIIQSEIKRVVYGEFYKNNLGIELLKSAQIVVDKLND